MILLWSLAQGLMMFKWPVVETSKALFNVNEAIDLDAVHILHSTNKGKSNLYFYQYLCNINWSCLPVIGKKSICFNFSGYSVTE